MTFSKHYRRFRRANNRFIRVMPWLWLVGCVGCVVVGVMGWGERWLMSVCLATIYPVLIGWLGFGSLLIMVRAFSRLSQMRYQRSAGAWLFFVWIFTIGLGSFACAVDLFVSAALWLVGH